MTKYTPRGLKPSRTKGKWDVTLSHKDPVTGELVPSYHTVEGKTRKRAVKERDELIRRLEQEGVAYTSKTTLGELLEQFISDKEKKYLVERSTIDGYRKEARVISLYIGGMRLARGAETTSLGLAIELALTTGMRRGGICALRWSDLGDHEITANYAISLEGGKMYEKNPETSGSKRTIPLTKRLYAVLRAIEKDAKRVAADLGVPFGDPYILGTPNPDSRPYHPTRLTKEFKSFCDMNGFSCTFHDLRHTFATMMIGNGTDVRTVASYLGHSNVALTLNTYADVDPDAKRAAVERVSDSFDIDDSFFDEDDPLGGPAPEPLTITLTMEQLEKLMAGVKRSEDAA